MALTDEQAKKIKDILLKHLDRFPEDRRSEIKDRLVSLDKNELENFLKENGLDHLLGECIFCSIVSGKVVSFKVGENEEGVAVLDINPASKGHVLVLQKKHGEGISGKVLELVDLVEKKIRDLFKPERIEKKEIEVMGHKAVELVPVYSGEKLERRKASEDELRDVVKRFEAKEPKDVVEVADDSKEGVVKLPPRIPSGPKH